MLFGIRRQEILNGPYGDHWALVERPLRTKWIKSHMSADEALRRGFTNEEWAGNEVADKAASIAAAFRDPKASARVRADQEELAEILHKVQSKAVQQVHTNKPKQKKTNNHCRKRGVRWVLRKPKNNKDWVHPVPKGIVPDGVHQLAWAGGPEMQGGKQKNSCLMAHCLKCNWKESKLSRWKSNVWFPCGESIPWQDKHRFAQIGNTLRCCRCYVKKRTTIVDMLCSVPTLGDEERDWWVGMNHRLRERWQQRWAEHLQEERKEASAEPLQCGLRRWSAHNLVEGSGKVACLDCGKFSSANKSVLGVRRAWWVHLPCGGKRQMPKVLQRLLDAGTFDGARMRHG